jgi:hypothetical protein
MEILLTLIIIILKPIGAIYCAKKAEELNRSSAKWALLALVFPIIAMVIISNKSKKTTWHNNV